MEKIALKIIGLSSTQLQSGAHALILAEEAGTRFLPIVISSWEAYPIAMAMEHMTPPRPMSADLFVAMAHGFGIRLEETLIYKFQDGVFYSQMTFSDGEHKLTLDGRTSDAVAIILRTSGKIYAAADVMDEAGVEVEAMKEGGKAVEEGQREIRLEDYAVEQLQEELKKAIDEEDYDMAARISKIMAKKNEGKGDTEE